MSLLQKLNEIRNWQSANLVYKPNKFGGPADANDFDTIESLLGEKFPEELRTLYAQINGETEDEDDETYGSVLGHSFVDTQEIISQLKFSKELIKPQNPTVKNPEKAEQYIKQITEFYLDIIPVDENSGTKKSWYKLKFECGPGSFSGPYLYASATSTDKEREILRIKDYTKLRALLTEFHELEKESYNWDKLKITLYSDGNKELERSIYNFEEEMEISSFPEGAIKKKYFHYKWIPLIKDSGGNYIGVDLDPDVNGKKGQVIVFGRDEQDMFVVGENLNAFFDYMLNELNNVPQSPLRESTHLHDTLKMMIVK